MAETKMEIKIALSNGERNVTLVEKKLIDIEKCEDGKIILISLNNGETYTGIYKGMDGKFTLMLGSTSSSQVIGVPTVWVTEYYEEIKMQDSNG